MCQVRGEPYDVHAAVNPVSVAEAEALVRSGGRSR